MFQSWKLCAWSFNPIPKASPGYNFIIFINEHPQGLKVGPPLDICIMKLVCETCISNISSIHNRSCLIWMVNGMKIIFKLSLVEDKDQMQQQCITQVKLEYIEMLPFLLYITQNPYICKTKLRFPPLKNIMGYQKDILVWKFRKIA